MQNTLNFLNCAVSTDARGFTSYSYRLLDIDGKTLARCTAVHSIGFDHLGGYPLWRKMYMAAQHAQIGVELYSELNALHGEMLRRALGNGADSVDIFFNRCGMFSALHAVMASVRAFAPKHE